MTLDEMIRAVPLFALIAAGLGGLWKLVQWALRQYRYGRTDAEKAAIEVERGRAEVSLLPLPAYQDLVTRLDERVDKLERERDRAEERLSFVEEERDKLEERIRTLENERYVLGRRIEALENEREILRVGMVGYRQENDRLIAENAELRAVQQELEERVAHLEAELALTKGGPGE